MPVAIAKSLAIAIDLCDLNAFFWLSLQEFFGACPPVL